MASLMMSAALPCMGWFMAVRSPNPRWTALPARSGYMALSAEHRDGVAGLFRLGHRFVEIRAHARVHLEVAVDHLLGLFEPDAQRTRQTERLLAVHDAEVDGFRAAAKLGRHLVDGNAEHARRRSRMEVGTAAERIDQALVARQMREQDEARSANSRRTRRRRPHAAARSIRGCGGRTRCARECSADSARSKKGGPWW